MSETDNRNPRARTIALAGLFQLSALYLQRNDINDISPLVENSGIGEFDFVYLEYNPIDCEDNDTVHNLRALENRYVYLTCDCMPNVDNWWD